VIDGHGPTGAMRWLASFSLLTAPRLPLPRTTCLHGITSAARWNSNRPKAKQSLGQNFLSDTTIARRIVQGLDDTVGTLRPGDDDGFRVIELGPGQGALTGQLLATYPAMTAVEIDQRMIEVLRESEATAGLADLREGDLLQLDFTTLADEKGGRLSIISNTPFYLTSALLFKMLGSLDDVDRAVLTMQKEVGDKVLAPHGCKMYGPLAVMLQLFAAPTRLLEIPPQAFRPQPKCSVSALRFNPSATPAGRDAPLSPAQRTQLLALVKITFEQRRKMLRQSLKKYLPNAATQPPDELLSLRPEQLEPIQFVELAEMLFGDDARGGGEAGLAASHASASWAPTKSGWHMR